MKPIFASRIFVKLVGLDCQEGNMKRRVYYITKNHCLNSFHMRKETNISIYDIKYSAYQVKDIEIHTIPLYTNINAYDTFGDGSCGKFESYLQLPNIMYR